MKSRKQRGPVNGVKIEPGKRVLLCVIGLVVTIGVWGCNGERKEEGDRVEVVATSTIIADLTNKIGGEEIALTSILKPGDDPHIYEPVPRDSIALEKADLILYNGYHLEPALIRMIEATGIKGVKIAIGESVKPIQNEDQGEKVPDPHVWGNAKNGILMVKAIRDGLIKISPEDQAVFEENSEALIKELEELDSWIKEQITSIPAEQRKLVTTHDAFTYYAQAYGLEVIGTLIGMSTEEQPSAQTVKNLADEIKKAKVPAIFAETTINPSLIKTVAQEAKVKVAEQELYSDSIGIPGSKGDSYVKMLKANTETIVNALKGDE